MELLINTLEVILFLAKVAFSISIVWLVACLGVWATDEYKEVQAERSMELARTSNIDQIVHTMVVEKRAYEARHRFDKTKPQYRHVAAAAAATTSYLERVRTETRNRVLPADDNFFAALLAEQKEFAPSW